MDEECFPEGACENGRVEVGTGEIRAEKEGKKVDNSSCQRLKKRQYGFIRNISKKDIACILYCTDPPHKIM